MNEVTGCELAGAAAMFDPKGAQTGAVNIVAGVRPDVHRPDP